MHARVKLLAVVAVCWTTAAVLTGQPAASLAARGSHLAGARQRAAALRFTDLMTDKELRGELDKWRKSTEDLYLVRYEKKVSITVTSDAAGFLVSEYVKRDLDPIFTQNRLLSRFVIRRDVGTVLNTAFVDAIRVNYKTWGSFLASDGGAVAVTIERVRAALETQDCNVIPCPPNKCNPDCSGNSFKRFGQFAPPAIARAGALQTCAARLS